MTDDSLLARALVEEATRKSGLVWVRGDGPARALWHVWHEGAAYVVGDGPGEQPLPPGLADGAVAEVTVRSKDKGGRIVAWTAVVAEPAPGSEEWRAAADELKGKRLNAPDAQTMTERWARECRLLRLTPRDAVTDLRGAPWRRCRCRPRPPPATRSRRPSRACC